MSDLKCKLENSSQKNEKTKIQNEIKHLEQTMKLEDIGLVNEEIATIEMAQFCMPKEIADSIKEYVTCLLMFSADLSGSSYTIENLLKYATHLENNRTLEKMEGLLNISYNESTAFKGGENN